MRCFAWCLLLVLAFDPTRASADELRPSVIEMTERTAGEWSLDWKFPVTSPDQVRMDAPVIPTVCEYVREPVHRAVPLAVLGSADVSCNDELAGHSFGLSGLIGRADAIARVVPRDAPSQTFRLTADEPVATIAAEPTTWLVAKSYFAIGVEHILMGWDHLLFVIALVLLVRRGWAVVKAATAFTIAHSITLVATTLGYTGLPGRPVEALIALSILFLAVELAKADRDTWTRRWPWLVAFAFGLLHGFGFAGALAEIGLPQGELPMALFAFNVGVEAGQLLVVAAIMALLALIARSAPKAERPAFKLATYGIGITASFWLFERILT